MYTFWSWIQPLSMRARARRQAVTRERISLPTAIPSFGSKPFFVEAFGPVDGAVESARVPLIAKRAQVKTCTNANNGPHGTVPWRHADHGAAHIAIGDDFAIGKSALDGAVGRARGPLTAETTQVKTCTNPNNGPHGTAHIAIGDDFAIGKPLHQVQMSNNGHTHGQPQTMLTRDLRTRGAAWTTYDTYVYNT
jgi:hypothetical protein